jgi:hypothetical protein
VSQGVHHTVNTRHYEALNKVVGIYPEDRTETTLANLVRTTEIMRSLSQLAVGKDFHSVLTWNNQSKHIYELKIV